MKNISPTENDFQNTEVATVAQINQLSAAIEAAPGNAVELLSAAIETETNSAVRDWLIRFREAFQPLNLGGGYV